MVGNVAGDPSTERSGLSPVSIAGRIRAGAALASVGAVNTPDARPWWTTSGWVLHAVLRCVLVLWMQAYIWSKLNLTQMGRMDYADALITVGEKSPMGLLWTLMAYSPVVQFLAGAVELLVVLLLVFRRTAWLGGLLGTVAMGTVFLLNMAYDVPVKQPALALTIGFALVAAPESVRVVRFVLGRSVPAAGGVPQLLPWPRVRRVTRWLSPALLLVVIALSGVQFQTLQPAYQRSDSPLAGVYRVVEDPTPPAPQLAGDRRWQQVAFGQWRYAGPPLPVPGMPAPGSAAVTIRKADGELVEGRYRPVRDGVVELSLRAPLAGATSVYDGPERTVELAWAVRPDGRVELTGAGQSLVVEPDAEARFLFDRGFSWSFGNEAAVNR